MALTTLTPSTAPSLLAIAWRRAVADDGTPFERLLSRLCLVEQSQRYLFAVLAARQCGAGLPPGQRVTALYRALRAPSLEAWGLANQELAEALVGVDDLESSLRPLVDLYVIDEAFRTASVQLHDIWRMMAPEAGWPANQAGRAEHLLREGEQAFQFFLTGIAVAGGLTPLWLQRKDRGTQGETTAGVWVLQGMQPRRLTLSLSDGWHAIPTRSTFLLLEGGRVLSLGPFVCTLQPRADEPPKTCLLSGWDEADKAFTYSDSVTDASLTLLPQEYANVPEDLEHLHQLNFGFRMRTIPASLATAIGVALATPAVEGAAPGGEPKPALPGARESSMPVREVRETGESPPQVLRRDLADQASSSDLLLRCYAPQPVASAYARAVHPGSDSREALGWQLGFVDVAIRFLLAVLTAQRIGLGLKPGRDFEQLRRKFTGPSLGDFCRAAEETARSLNGHPIDSRLQELVALYLGSSVDGSADGRSEFALHLQALVELRNQMVHQGATCLPPETMAESALAEAADRIKAVCVALRVLRHHPILYVESSKRRPDQSTTVVLRRFAGLTPDRVEVVLPRGEQLPDEQPFLLLDSGAVLLLAPFVAVGPSERTGFRETRMLYKWDLSSRLMEYDPADGGERAPLRGAVPIGFEEAIAKLAPTAAETIWEGAVAPERVEALRGAPHEEGLPRFPGYHLERRIGAGTSSSVYLGKATDGSAGQVAIKVLNRAVREDRSQLERLAREYRLLCLHPHPHIVQMYDMLTNPLPALVMEYIDGEDLGQRVARGALAPEMAVQIGMEVLDALESVHAHGIFHRDIKPANVLLDARGRARLIDFGTAKVVGEARLTMPSDVLGTLAFSAPEQLERGIVSAASDLYAVGRLLSFMTAGRITSPGAPALPGFPELEAVIRRATAAQPAERWESASAMRQALAALPGSAGSPLPLQVGDRVGGRLIIRATHGAVAQTRLFEAEEEGTGELVNLAIAGPRPEDRAPLLAVCQRGSRQLLRELGLQMRSDQGGLLLAVFDAGMQARQALARAVGAEAGG
ncbi:MAG: serine/threonine-protein kinase [Candidatus Sericytochromatia bacterium]|nr:serine/threonine-protein kinase [Candidatus Sericytochromatia bacterium]